MPARGKFYQTVAAQHLGAALLAVLAAVLMTWPLARHSWDQLLGAAYYWDAYTNAMIMGARVDALLGRAPLSLYDDYFFAPLPHSIVFNENHFALSLIFAPFYLLGRNPLWAYNLTLLASMALSVFFTYLLVRRLTGNGSAGVVAGVAFAFCPYVMFEIGRIQLIATQWIPACFLMLHRAIEERRLRDVVGLWLCYVAQIGTCLYYAMFLLPLLGLVGATLLFRQRPPRTSYLQLALGGLVAGGLAFAMVHPYFTARDSFFLERTLSFASSYDGELAFFGYVHPTNLTLTALHHEGQYRGAHEEVAFPGFTVLAMLLLALVVPLYQAARTLGPKGLASVALRWLAIAALVILASLGAKSALAGAAVFGMAVWHQSRARAPLPLAGQRGLYLALLLLSVSMFLGLELTRVGDAPVHGLYYYFHSYFPGFNGIRKVSRQAVMTSFVLAVLASFGSAWLLGKLSRFRDKALVTAGLLAATCFELRCYPHPMVREWAGSSVPEVYRFLAKQPQSDLIAIIPQNEGVSHFRGDKGMALHNYLALYHRHRFVNGQSSWMPPITELVRRAQLVLPDAGARRALLSAGVKHLLIHGADLGEAQRSLPARLLQEPSHYQLAFNQGADYVFTLLPDDEPTEPLATPRLPASSVLVPTSDLTANASARPNDARRGIDGDVATTWLGARQLRGQYFEVRLREPRPLVAFEIENPARVMDVPSSFSLQLRHGAGAWTTVAARPQLRLFREQIFAPQKAVFRIVWDAPVLADQLRIVVDQPVPLHDFAVQEARLYSAPE